MKKTCLTCLSMLIFLLGNAQNYPVKWGQAVDVSNSTDVYQNQIFHLDTSYYYLNKDVFLFNAFPFGQTDFAAKEAVALNLLDNNQDPFMGPVFTANNKLYGFTIDNLYENVVLTEFDFKEEELIFHNVDMEVKAFSYVLSPDQKSLLIYYMDLPEKKDRYYAKIVMVLYDLIEYKKIDGETIFLSDYEAFGGVVEDVKLDNNQNFYVLAKRELKKKKYKFKHDYKLYYFTRFGFENVGIDLNKRNVPMNAGILNADDQKVTVGGHYAAKAHKKVGVHGSFLYKLDLDGDSIIYNEYNRFSYQVVQAIGQESSLKDGMGIKDVYTKHFVTQEDGTMSIIAEEKFDTEDEEDDPIELRESIIVSKYGANGKFLWETSIDRYFLGDDEEFVVIPHKEDLHFLFNSMRKELYAKPVRTKVASIEENGVQFTMFTLFDPFQGMQWVPPATVRLENDRLLLLRKNRKHLQLGLIDFGKY